MRLAFDRVQWLGAVLILAAPAVRGQNIPISPTGIPYTVPAAARAAGWTIAEPQARTAFFGSNPVFLAGATRYEVAIDAAWLQRGLENRPQFTLDEVETRLAAVTGKATFGRLSLGAAYQLPFRARFTAGATPAAVDLRSAVGGVALQLLPGLRVGASVANVLLDRSRGDLNSYQANFGAEFEFLGASVAASARSRLFGADADSLAAPLWLQLDGRVPVGPLFSIGARLGFGRWSDVQLKDPFEVGLGVRWMVLPVAGALAGIRHVKETTRSPVATPADLALQFYGITPLDQGTFLDAGVELNLAVIHVALAVEDNHVSHTASPTTQVTLSAHAGF